MDKKYKYPDFVTMGTIALRHIGEGIYYRDGGEWRVATRITEWNSLASISDQPAIHNKHLSEITEDQWRKSNGKYAPDLKKESMKLYLLSQSTVQGHDTYGSCIVCAENEDDAKSITPDEIPFGDIYSTWCKNKSDVNCEEIGEANAQQERGVILSSFNAG